MSSTRKIIPRSRNGCAVCKSKRLKCDEAKPQCSRCQRLGITCPGYRKVLRWNATSMSPSGNPSSPRAMGPTRNLRAAENTLDQTGPYDQSTGAVYDLDLFNSFIDNNTPESLDLDPFFTAPNNLTEKEQRPAGVRPESLNLTTPDNNSIESLLWPEILSGTSCQVEPYSRAGEPFAAHCNAPLVPSLRDNSSTLVEYYFKEVCGMMSCYDSDLNPYRTTISNLWTHSPSLYYVTQSMAAACLSEVSPGYLAASGRLGDQAVKSLWNESKANPKDTSSLLALVMLGFSLCWHDPRRLGQAEFQLLAETFMSLNDEVDDRDSENKQKRLFFYNSLTYWKMLLSFVTDQELPSLESPVAVQPQPSHPSLQKRARMPHPQTGLGVEIQELVAQVGVLVRRERKRIRSRRHSSRRDIEQSMNAIRTSEELHSKLCSVELPKAALVIDSGDDMTPADHLLKAAEAYRCTGLLQLYRNFPDLFLRDIESTDLMSQSCWLDTIQNSDVAQHRNPGVLLDTWLTSLSLHILDLVEEIPMSSRSRSIQPLLLVSICSELSLNRSFVPLLDFRGNSAATMFPSTKRMEAPPTTTDILHARRTILSRLAYFEGVLAAKPIRQMLNLVKETWQTMDNDQEDIYWMDVMIERGYETLMG